MVRSFSDFFNDLPETFAPIKDAPTPLAFPVTGSLIFYEAYKPGYFDGVPWEWVPELSDCWLPVTDISDAIAVWKAVVECFWKSQSSENNSPDNTITIKKSSSSTVTKTKLLTPVSVSSKTSNLSSSTKPLTMFTSMILKSESKPITSTSLTSTSEIRSVSASTTTSIFSSTSINFIKATSTEKFESAIIDATEEFSAGSFSTEVPTRRKRRSPKL